MNPLDELLERIMTTSREKATAYHEASHAVAAISLGLRSRKKGISIERDKDSLGQCHTRKPFRGDPDEATDTQRVRAEKDAIVSLVGYEGQRTFCPRSHNRGWKDHKDAASLMCHFVGSERDVDAYMKLLQFRTEQFLCMEHIQRKIKAVAEAVIKRKRLSAAEVEAIVGSQ
jgi:hypothetical protein